MTAEMQNQCEAADSREKEFAEKTVRDIKIEIFDINGRLVYNCIGGLGGSHQPINTPTHLPIFSWQPLPSAPSGIYFIKTTIGNQNLVEKVVYLK